jgi:RNA polymerase sigma-70 factor (ECF subfamily)
MTSDDQLILEFQQGSREAFCEIFERYREPMYRFFRRRLRDQARAEELAQECFVALLRNATRYEPRASFRSYLYGIAVNMVSAERRKASRELRSGDSPDEIPDPVAKESETTFWVRSALEKLDRADREILMLREYEQLTYAEIAYLLRLPVNTVRSRLFRARMALKDQLMPAKDYDRGIQ